MLGLPSLLEKYLRQILWPRESCRHEIWRQIFRDGEKSETWNLTSNFMSAWIYFHEYFPSIFKSLVFLLGHRVKSQTWNLTSNFATGGKSQTWNLTSNFATWGKVVKFSMKLFWRQYLGLVCPSRATIVMQLCLFSYRYFRTGNGERQWRPRRRLLSLGHDWHCKWRIHGMVWILSWIKNLSCCFYFKICLHSWINQTSQVLPNM